MPLATHGDRLYVALSRVETLAQFRSIGLTNAVREITESGPPAGLPRRFAELFEEKNSDTKVAVAEAMRFLGWPDEHA